MITSACLAAIFLGGYVQPSVPFEVLHRALVGFSFFARTEGSQVAALAGLGVLLAGVKAVLAGFEFTNHDFSTS